MTQVSLAAVAVAATLGCGGNPDGTVAVTGTVTVDGNPVAKEGYGVRFEVAGKQNVVDINSDGTFNGFAFEGKGNAWLAGGYTDSEADAAHAVADETAADQEDVESAAEDAEFAPIPVEVTSGTSFDLDFTKH